MGTIPMGTIEKNIPLKNKNSYRIGGNAQYYLKVQSVSDIIEGLLWAHEQKIPWFVLGKGSNILIHDDGFRGLVLDFTAFKSIRWSDDGTVVCAGGALLQSLVRSSVDRGYYGMECLAGIPGTVGGGVIMNAGAFGQEISECLTAVTLIDPQTAQIKRYTRNELDFGYRTSSVKRTGAIVVSSEFHFGDKKEEYDVLEKYHEILERRNGKQPLNYPNCGSVFKRPPGNYAGTLIEKCDLKGLQIGGAQVSEKHGNFIVNVNKATAKDVSSLITHIQKTVSENTEYELEREVIYVGDF